MISRWVTWIVVGVLLGSCGPREEAVTWSGSVAGIIHRHCAICHRPGQPAPFSLLTFDDARRKRRQIGRVTASGYMPPWLPSHGTFIGARGLSQAEVDRVSAWIEGGAPRGDLEAEPSPPTFLSGWQLGEPDLVLTAEEWLEVPAAGPDLFQNLVLPVESGALRFVDAVELRPGNPSVHHAVLQVDGTRGARALDAAEPGPGFGGMEMGLSVPPDGHFLGWTPGKATRRNGAGRAWRLWPGDDLVLQLHLTPTGKPERVRPSIGLYFTDVPPEETPFALVMRSERIDIAAGEPNFRAADHVVLPVATELRAVYPHAHYLCTHMVAWATPPRGRAAHPLRDRPLGLRLAGRLPLPHPRAARGGDPRGLRVRLRQLGRQPEQPVVAASAGHLRPRVHRRDGDALLDACGGPDGGAAHAPLGNGHAGCRAQPRGCGGVGQPGGRGEGDLTAPRC
ncbi:hypothetical protein N9Z54_09395 [Planctomycetota bacterium]|nr:hypothetical protein [Planctomycetota bacterium]